ncbi:hydroxypyruvate isomerase-like [Homarus americanus]|uniref:Hydroxypyruvate isomerase-like n=1 Tax=Homarus americanus TaxID=6706 RepID=A0A8J5NAP6_HOMAM|nr:hydroxypyruvate isomerase-like [Homarus americanus]
MKVVLLMLATIAAVSGQTEPWCRCAAFVTYEYSEIMVYEEPEIPIDSCDANGALQCKTTCADNTMKVAANLSFMFGEAGGLLARYKAAREAGFLAVECAFPYSVPEKDVAAVLKEEGLEQVLINSDPVKLWLKFFVMEANNFTGDLQAGELGFAAVPGQETRFRESLERSISFAKALGCHKLHIMSGHQSADHNEKAHVTTLESNLRHAVSRLAKEDIVGLIEPINPVSIPGYFLNNYDTGILHSWNFLAVSLIEKIESPYLRLQLDVFHLQMICGNVTNNIKKLIPLTVIMLVLSTVLQAAQVVPSSGWISVVLHSKVSDPAYNWEMGC